VKGRRGRRCKQLLDNRKGKKEYWKLNKEALDRPLWRTRFGRGYGPVVRHYRMVMSRYEVLLNQVAMFFTKQL